MNAPIPRPGIDLMDRAIAQNPYPIYAELRKKYPVCELEPDAQIALTRYEDVAFALAHPELYSAGIAAIVQPEWIREDCKRSMFILGMDPPEHTRNRVLVNKAFVPRMIEAEIPAMHRRAQRLADSFDGGVEQDFIETFAFPYANGVMGEILGAEIDLKHLRHVTEIREMNTPLRPSAQHIALAEAALSKQNDYYDAIIQRGRERPGDDLLTVLLRAQSGAEPLSHAELRSALDLFVSAGFHTTGQLITNCVLYLAQWPQLRATLLAAPERIPAFIDEVLRYNGPVHRIFRVAKVSVFLHGVTIPAGRIVAVIAAAANHDPSRFERPEEFDPERPNLRQHLQFGHGAHFCIGAALARMETRVALEVLLSRFKQFECPRPDELEWISTMTTRAVRKMPVRFF